MPTQVLHSVIEVDDPTLDVPTRERAAALDAWLWAECGEAWRSLRSQWRLPPVESACARDLWSFFLAANHVARGATSDQGPTVASLVEALAGDPIDLERPVALPGGGAIALPLDHETVRSDLRTVAHPEIMGTALRGLPANAIGSEVRDTIADAVALIFDANPVIAGLVRHHCGAVALLGCDPQLPAGKCVSLTSKLVPGIVYITPVPVILMAESIAHESAHLCLSAHERRTELYSGATRQVMTPLRPDPRPISGLMHQVWVLHHLVQLYLSLLQSRPDVVERNLRPVEKRLALHEAGLAQGVEALRGAGDGLSPDGRRLVEAIAAAKGA